jgi:hypothetical protein
MTKEQSNPQSRDKIYDVAVWPENFAVIPVKNKCLGKILTDLNNSAMILSAKKQQQIEPLCFGVS